MEVETGNETRKPTTTATGSKGPWFGVRHLQMFILFILIFVAYGMRSNLSVAIVAMTDSEVNKDFPTYNWSDKSVVLSSFFWGYILPQIGAGQLAEKYGPKWFLSGTMFLCSAFTVLIPTMANLGSWGVMICRIGQGLTQGFIYPSCHNLLGRWIPLSERSRLSNFVYAGGILGTVVALPVSGWISESSLGWPFVFYLYAVLGFAWVLLWSLVGANNPSEYKNISEEEKNFISESLMQTTNQTKLKTPWKSFAKSVPVWAILLTHVGQNWGYWTLSTEIPIYMAYILDFKISDNGLLSACPYLTFWFFSFVFSALSDFFINKKYLTVGATRKLANSIGLYGPAISLIVLGILTNRGASTSAALALLLLAVGINSASYSGYQINHIDLSPNFAGTLMGITNAAAGVSAILGPLAVQVIVKDETNPNQWGIVFFIAATIYIVANTIFVFFGSGEVQPWDSPSSEEKTNKNHQFSSETSTV